MKQYDIVVVGGGPGGYVAAIKAAQYGAQVALIESEVVGGICLNHGCIPTKALLKTSKTFDQLSDLESLGLSNTGQINFDWKKVIARKDGVVKQLTSGIAFLLKKNKVDLFNGFGTVLSRNEVKVGDQTLKTKNVIIATGSSAIVPPIPGAKEAYEKGDVVTSRELLNVVKAPKRLTIIGGGVIGVEFATIFSQMGSEVTIVEKMPTILPTIEEDIVKEYARRLKKDGIKIFNEAEVTKIDGTNIEYKLGDKVEKLEGDLVLMSVGVRANLGGLEALNLKLEGSSIQTDEYLRTNIPGVYAIGDVNGKFMLAHVASHEGILAVEHILEKGTHKMRYDRIPSAVYGSPEIAVIGMTEKEAKEKGLDYKVSRVPVAAVGKAIADGDKEGFIKLIVDKKYLEVLGAHIYAYNATELISEFSVAMESEATAHEIARAIHPHPTLSELNLEAALGAIDKPIHF